MFKQTQDSSLLYAYDNKFKYILNIFDKSIDDKNVYRILLVGLG